MTGEERALLEIFRRLDSTQRRSLIEFGEFLASRQMRKRTGLPHEPLPIERPEQETVVMAIQRLVRTYPMLDRRKLLGEASHFVGEYALGGRAAQEVIDELETMFAKHYEEVRNDDR